MSITAHHYITTKVTLPTDNTNMNIRLFCKTIADKIISVCGATAVKYINDETNQGFYASLDLGTGEGLAIYKSAPYYVGYIGLIEPGHTEMTTLKRYVQCAVAGMDTYYRNQFVIFEENGKLLAISFYKYSASYTGINEAPLFFYHNDDGSIDMGFCEGYVASSGDGLDGVIRLGEYKYQGQKLRAMLYANSSTYTYYETGKAKKTYCMKTDRTGKIIDRLEYPVHIYNRNSTLPSSQNTVFTRIRATEVSGNETTYMALGGGGYYMPYDTWITENISV